MTDTLMILFIVFNLVGWPLCGYLLLRQPRQSSIDDYHRQQRALANATRRR